MANVKEQSKEFAKAISLMVVRAAKMNPEEVIAGFDEIETSFLRKAGSSKKLQLETIRRVAEWKFKLLSERDLPMQIIEKLHGEICALGFTDLETEGTIEIYYAQYLSRQSRTEDAKRILEALCGKLDKALAAKELLVHRHLRQEAQKLLSVLNK